MVWNYPKKSVRKNSIKIGTYCYNLALIDSIKFKIVLLDINEINSKKIIHNLENIFIHFYKPSLNRVKNYKTFDDCMNLKELTDSVSS